MYVYSTVWRQSYVTAYKNLNVLFFPQRIKKMSHYFNSRNLAKPNPILWLVAMIHCLGTRFSLCSKHLWTSRCSLLLRIVNNFFPQPRGRLGGGKAWLYCRQKEECNLIKENLHALTHHTYFRNGSKNILLYADSDFQRGISGNYLRFEGYKCL